MPAEPSPRVLGRMLLAAGAVDEAALEAALEEQRGTRERLGEVLVRRGVDPEAVARTLAAQLRLPLASQACASWAVLVYSGPSMPSLGSTLEPIR